MEEEATHLHKPTFQVPSKLNQLALGLQTAFVLIQLSGVFHHCFLPPLNHHILQGRNQDILTFIIPVLSTARVHESCTICIYHIETHHWMLVYVSTLCNLYFPMTNISMLKSQIYVKCDWSLFLSLQSTFFSWELREEREQVSKLYFLILKPPVFFSFPPLSDQFVILTHFCLHFHLHSLLSSVRIHPSKTIKAILNNPYAQHLSTSSLNQCILFPRSLGGPSG